MITESKTQEVDESAEIGQILDEYLRAIEAGGPIDEAALLARHAHLADALAPAIEQLRVLRRVSSKVADVNSNGFHVTLFEPAKELGDYRIVREVGRGGMGIVYEAEQMSLGRRIALKVLPFAAILDERHLLRFKNEVRAAATLHHPNIVPVHAVGCERGVHFYAMQYIEGQSLAQVIVGLQAQNRFRGAIRRSNRPWFFAIHKSGGASSESATSPLHSIGDQVDGSAMASPPDETAPSESQGRSFDTFVGNAIETILTAQRDDPAAFFRTIARLGVQAADALQHAHEHGIIHRDIKPANLMVDATGNLWIADFGLARLDAEAGMTMTGDIVGTLRYMSPEQASGKPAVVDHRADIYSLGMTLYELLTFKPAFPADDRQGLARQVANDEPRGLRQLNPLVPWELETIVLKAIAKNAGDRYQTASDLASDLRRYIEDKPIQARRPSLVDRVAKWSRRHRGFVCAAATLLVVATIGSTFAAVMINRSLEAERIEHTRAEDNVALAETNLYIALNALGDIHLTLLGDGLSNQPDLSDGDRRLIERVLEHYVALAESNQDNIRLERHLFEIYQVIARARFRLGLYEEALEAQRRAVELARKRLARAPDDDTLRHELSTSLCDYVIHLSKAGKRTAAREAIDESIAIQEDLRQKYPERLRHVSLLSTLYNNYDATALPTDNPTICREKRIRGIELARTLVQRAPQIPGFRCSLASQLYISSSSDEEGIRKCREALTLLEPDSSSRSATSLRCKVQRHIAIWHLDRQQSAEALPLIRDAVAARERIVFQNPHDLESHKELIKELAFLGDALERGTTPPQREDALSCYRRALDVGDDFLVRHAFDDRYRDEVELDALVRVYQQIWATKARDTAVSILRDRAERWRQLIDRQPQNAVLLKVGSRALVAFGEFSELQPEGMAEAESAFKESTSVAETLVKHHPDDLDALRMKGHRYYYLARFYRRAGRAQEARAAQDQALAAFDRVMTNWNSSVFPVERLSDQLRELAGELERSDRLAESAAINARTMNIVVEWLDAADDDAAVSDSLRACCEQLSKVSKEQAATLAKLGPSGAVHGALRRTADAFTRLAKRFPHAKVPRAFRRDAWIALLKFAPNDPVAKQNALSSSQASIAALESELEQDQANRDTKRQLAAECMVLGKFHARNGADNIAGDLLCRAIAVYEGLIPGSTEPRSYHQGIAEARSILKGIDEKAKASVPEPNMAKVESH